MSRTVLVIDDEPDVVLMIRLALELRGYRVVEAGTGTDGIEAILRENPDAVLLDLRLPDIDGWDVIEDLRARGRFDEQPVIIISAHASPGTSERAVKLGCTAYVRKPFHPDALVAVVDRALATA